MFTVKGDGRVFRPVHHSCPPETRASGCACPPLRYWHIAYWAPKGDGSWCEFRESSKSEDERDARKLLRERIAEVISHQKGHAVFIGPKKERLTVRDILGALESDYETRRLPSLPQTRNCIKHLNAAMGAMRATSVTRETVLRYIKLRRSQNASDATIDRETEKLARAFSIAIEDNQLAQKPKIPRLVKLNANARQGFFEKDEIRAVLDAIDHPDARDFLDWFRWTGMRPKEIRSLTWDCFDRDEWVVRLPHKSSKTGYGRSFPLGGYWKEIIERRIARRRLDCDLIFHLDGKPMPNIQKRWKRACKAAGMEGKIMYDLRRTAVRDMIRAGIPLSTVKQISGHRTDAMVARYNIISEADLREAGLRLGRFVAGLERKPEGTVVPFGSRTDEGGSSETGEK